MTTLDIIQKLYGVQTYEVDNPLTTAVLTTPTQILPNDPGGLQITIVNLGTNDLFLWTDPSVSATKGIQLQANGGSYEIDFTRFMTLPAREWWAIGSGGTTTVSVKRVSILK